MFQRHVNHISECTDITVGDAVCQAGQLTRFRLSCELSCEDLAVASLLSSSAAPVERSLLYTCAVIQEIGFVRMDLQTEIVTAPSPNYFIIG